MIVNERNLFVEEVIIEEEKVFLSVITLNLTVEGVPVQGHLVFLVFNLELFGGLVRYGGEDFEVFLVVVEHFDPAVGYLLEVVAGNGQFLVEEVPVALLEAGVREDPDDGELFGDDFLEIVLEFEGDFEG